MSNNFFDFNNDGKMDLFETEAERQHIINNLNGLENNNVSLWEALKTGFWILVIIVVVVYCIAAL